MIISHKHKLLFVEIPHTASHSIAGQLVAHYGGEPILRKHANVTQFLGQASETEKTYFRFATVRNPLDTATTDYAKLKGNHKGQYTNPAMLIENGGHITEDHLREYRFIQENNADFGSFFTQFRNRLYNNWFLIGHQKINYIIRFEQLQEGFSELLRKLRIDQVEPIPHVNKTRTKTRSYEEFFSPEVVAQVARCYGPFMKKWGYAFPESWGKVQIPLSSRLAFALVDRCASAAARHFVIDPDQAFIHRAKRTLDTLTHRN